MNGSAKRALGAVRAGAAIVKQLECARIGEVDDISSGDRHVVVHVKIEKRVPINRAATIANDDVGKATDRRAVGLKRQNGVAPDERLGCVTERVVVAAGDCDREAPRVPEEISPVCVRDQGACDVDGEIHAGIDDAAAAIVDCNAGEVGIEISANGECNVTAGADVSGRAGCFVIVFDEHIKESAC